VTPTLEESLTLAAMTELGGMPVAAILGTYRANLAERERLKAVGGDLSRVNARLDLYWELLAQSGVPLDDRLHGG
jgi:hypothetical protein